MKNKTSTDIKQDRRRFMKLMSTGSIICLGCSHLCGSLLAGSEKPVTSGKHKFLDDAKMNFEEVVKFAYHQLGYKMKILAEMLAKEIGRDKCLKLMQDAASESTFRESKEMLEAVDNKNDFASFTSELREPNYFVNHILTYDIVENKEKVFAIKITECIWEKILREANATDIGYALFCHRDFSTARAFNPKIRLIRNKTLMQGHDCCNHRWIFAG